MEQSLRIPREWEQKHWQRDMQKTFENHGKQERMGENAKNTDFWKWMTFSFSN